MSFATSLHVPDNVNSDNELPVIIPTAPGTNAALLQGLQGHPDGIPVNVALADHATATAQATANGHLSDIFGAFATAATAALQATANTALANILAKLSADPALGTKQDTGNTSLASILAKQPADPSLGAKQDTANTALANILAKLATVLIVGGATVLSAATLVRPADTAAYTAQDVIANLTSGASLITFTNVARVAGGSGYITKARIVTNQATNTAKYRLHLYHTAPTALQDNAAFLTAYANKDKSVGSIDFSAVAQEATGGDAAGSANISIRLPFVCPAGSSTLYGILECLDAFTPTSGQSFFIELTAEQN